MAKDTRMQLGLAIAACAVLASPAIAAEPKVRSIQAPAAATQQQLQKNVPGTSGTRLFDELELTSEQRESCLAVVRQGWEFNRAMRRQARETWHELMAALRRPGATLEEAIATQRKLGRYQELLAEKRIETFFAFRRLLTPEQLDKLSSLRIDSAFWFEEDDGESRSTKQRRNDVPPDR